MLRILLIAAILVTIACAAAKAGEPVAKPPDSVALETCITSLAWAVAAHNHYLNSRGEIGVAQRPQPPLSVLRAEPDLQTILKRDCDPFINAELRGDR